MRRRRFMKLIAAGAAAVLTQPVERSLAAAAKRPAPEPPAPPASVRREIASQKKSLAETLRVIRAYKLPPGSPPAFVFRAAKRKGDSRA